MEIKKNTSKCDICKKEYRNKSLMWYQGEHICKICYKKKTMIIPVSLNIDEVEKRVRVVTAYNKKHSIIKVPPHLVNHKVIVKVVGSPNDSIDSIKEMRNKEWNG